MTKHPHPGQRRDEPQPSETKDTYQVGYCRPPVHSRFKQGQVPNRRGRPKGQCNVKTVVRKALNKRIKIREGNRTRSITKLDAFIHQMTNAAISENPKAHANLIALLRSLGMTEEPPESTHQEPFTADDHALIEDFLQRNLKRGPAS